MFCFIIICLSLSDDANQLNLWILKGNNNFSYLWKFEPDIANSFGEISFEKPENLQRMYELINVFTTQQFRSFWWPAISFVIACKELKISQPVEASFYGIRQEEGKFPPARRIPCLLAGKLYIKRTIEKKT